MTLDCCPSEIQVCIGCGLGLCLPLIMNSAIFLNLAGVGLPNFPMVAEATNKLLLPKRRGAIMGNIGKGPRALRNWLQARTCLAVMGMVSALLPHSVQATNFFSWGVESNYTPNSVYPVQYSSGKPAGALSARDCTVAHSGGCSMRLTVIGADSGNQPLGADVIEQKTLPFNIIGGPAIYYRWWMKIMPGFSWGNGTAKTKSGRVLTSGAASTRVYTGYVMSYGVLVGECDPACKTNTGAINTDSNLFVPYNFRAANDGKWHEYIVMVKPNSSASCIAGTNCDAQLKLWVDNVLVGSNVGWKMYDQANVVHIEAWGSWMVYPYFQLNGTAADGGTIYLDDFSTDDVYNSLLVFPAPTNLKAQ